jgi:hypothetical protein
VRRINLLPEPARSYWESQVYTEPLPNGKAYQFCFVNEVIVGICIVPHEAPSAEVRVPREP